jgi:hypothetical protein
MEQKKSEPLIRPEDLLSLEDYERVRADRRRAIIEEKRHRRVAVGEFVTFVFENRMTALFQIQEMLCVESISDPEGIRQEIEAYDTMVPRPRELRVTMLIELDEPDRRRRELDRLIGIEKNVAIEIGAAPVPAEFHRWRETETTASPVNFAVFHFTPELVREFTNPAVPVRIVITHPAYQAEAAISGETREVLGQELTLGLESQLG